MPYAWIVLVIIWWAVSSVMKNAKNAQQNQQRQAARTPQPKPQSKPGSQNTQPAPMSRAGEWEDEEDSWDERDAKRRQQSIAPRVKPQPVQASPVPKHSSRPFEAHMHTPVMGVEGVGTEGIDCCHEFMLGDTPEPEPADFLPMQEEEQGERAKALLQGVIYSEILGRRPVKRYHVKRS